MSNLKEVAQLAYDQIFCNPTDEEKVHRVDFYETARLEYAYQFLLWYWKEKALEGWFNIPGNLSSEHELDVVNDEVDISKLDIMSRLPNDMWVQNIGGLTCDCKYIKSNINQTQLLCGDDSMPEEYKPYVIVGKKIKFPKGTHTTPISIIVANSGKSIDDSVEVDDSIAAIVRTRLIQIYGGQMGVEDKSNNSNAEVK